MVFTSFVENDDVAHTEGMHLCGCRTVIAVELFIEAVKGIAGTEISVVNILVVFHADRISMLFDKIHSHEDVIVSRRILFDLVDRIAVHIPLRDIGFHFIENLCCCFTDRIQRSAQCRCILTSCVTGKIRDTIAR